MNSAYLHTVKEVIAELHDRGFFSDCSALVTDSRKVGPQDVFLAVPGGQFDPRMLADDLIDNGCCGLVLAEYDESRIYKVAQVVQVKGLANLLPDLAKQYYGDPSKSLNVIAITGTNGKTTTTRWLAQVLNALGKKAGVIGTLGFGLPDQLRQHSGLTTPDAVGVQRILHLMLREGFEWVCLEASSIGLDQGRLQGVHLHAAGYLNLSRDHLDYHGTLEAYAEAKNKLATWPKLQYAVANQDDPSALKFAEKARQAGAQVSTFGQSSEAGRVLGKIEQNANGLAFELDGHWVQTGLVGHFNAYNLALVFSLLLACGAGSKLQLLEPLSRVTAAPGRMQVVNRHPLVVVDYAHTPDALDKALEALRPMVASSSVGNKLRVAFGCGGDRDPGKRPLMAQVAVNKADVIYLTSDNPRSESPQQIIQDMLAGVPESDRHRVHVELDRKEAINRCLTDSAVNDVVLLAGKGHERTQTIGATVLPHCDTECVERYFSAGGLA